MIFPDYDGKNTVNLISTVQGFCGVEQKYKELDILNSEELNKYDNIVLFLVDGLGSNWLNKYAKDSFLYKNVLGEITSVFPSTTATAVTTFVTGYTASEHAILGRNMYTKEAGSIIQILPWKNKILKTDLGENLKMQNIATKRNFFEKSNKDIIVITSELFEKGKFNPYYNDNSKVFYYNNLLSCFDNIEKAVTLNKKKKYIYSYWGEFDGYCHDFGINSKEAINHFEDIDYAFEKLQNKLKGTNTLIIVSADHGQINIPNENKINITEKYPELSEMLTLPMAGEARYQYCFIKDGYKEKFKNYIEDNLKNIVNIYSKEDIIENKLFGYGNNQKFIDRLGDFLLIPKDNYAIFHNTLGENIKPDIGFHGGLSEWEINVPIICIK